MSPSLLLRATKTATLYHLFLPLLLATCGVACVLLFVCPLSFLDGAGRYGPNGGGRKYPRVVLRRARLLPVLTGVLVLLVLAAAFVCFCVVYFFKGDLV